jgi:hypothetical protein
MMDVNFQEQLARANRQPAAPRSATHAAVFLFERWSAKATDLFI